MRISLKNIRIIFQFIIVLSPLHIFANLNSSSLPQPLFEIKRSTNANILNYSLKLTDSGEFDPKAPIEAHWLMLAEDGHPEEMTWLEKSMAYGFSVEPSSSPSILYLRIKALESRLIAISLGRNGPQAETFINGKKGLLKHIFVKTSAGLFPSVDFVKISGLDPRTGNDLYEIIH